MKHFCVFMVVVILLATMIPELNAADDEYVSLRAGASMQPRNNWHFRSILGDDTSTPSYIQYDMQTTSLSAYETNLQLPAGISLGALVDVDDTVIGKTRQILGYLGIKDVIMRVSQSSMRGTMYWNGALAGDMQREFEFDKRIRNLDLLYQPDWLQGEESTRPIDGGKWFYIGLGYTEFSAPIEIKTLVTPGGKENQKYGVPVYDDDYRIKSWAFLFGFDTLAGSLRGDLSHIELAYGFTFFGAAQDRIGFGPARLSDRAALHAEILNPGRQITDKRTTAAYLENDSTLGLAWIPPFLGGYVGIAAGWNLTFASITSFGAAAEKAEDLGYDSGFEFFHHGPVFRIYAVW